MEPLHIGILSMQRICNYGSFLQAYCLKSMFEKMGCNVEFVDYVPGDCLVKNNNEPPGWKRKIIKGIEILEKDASLANKISYIKHKEDFSKKFFPMLGLTKDLNLNPEIDMLVIGSDEVFNCVQDNTNVGFTPRLFGDGISARRKITYAASFGNTTLTKLEQFNIRDKVAGWISNLDSLSVRDSNSGKIVKDLTNQEPLYHLDPVLISDFSQSGDLIPKEVDEEGYLILYGYSGRFIDSECDAIRKYAAGHGLKVLNIGGIQSCCDRFINCTPFEVLAYFQHAEAVVTDTFHGTIFSIIGQCPFAVFVRERGYGNSEKLNDLLLRMDMTDRIVANNRTVDDVLGMSVDSDSIQKLLLSEREKSFNYLRKQVELCKGVI